MNQQRANWRLIFAIIACGVIWLILVPGEQRDGLIFLFVLIGLFTVKGYNRLVRLKNHCLAGWSAIDVQLKRRADLVKNLVQTVRGYARHEHETFLRVAEARASALSKVSSPEAATAEGKALSECISQVYALVETYPDLKANGGFAGLQAELTGTEDRIQHARDQYNAIVRDYNVAIASFPSILVAKPFGYEKFQFFTISEVNVAVPMVVDALAS